MNAAVLAWVPEVPESRRLWVAIGISVAIHALLLTLHFRFPEASRAMQEKALDIILVNARSAAKPANAQALAQANLDGGGNTEEDRRAGSPLPPTRQQVAGSDVETLQRRVQEMESRQHQMLTQAKSSHSAPLTRRGQEQQPVPATVSGLDLAESARAMARLEAEINKSVEEYNKRPRKKFLGTRTEEYALAPYLDAWKQKIERIGTLNYPQAARGKLYGAVTIYVELRAEDGSLYNAEISRSSGHKLLDEAALRILNMAAPFGPIPRQALGGATVLSFARTWQFTQGNSLNTAVAK